MLCANLQVTRNTLITLAKLRNGWAKMVYFLKTNKMNHSWSIIILIMLNFRMEICSLETFCFTFSTLKMSLLTISKLQLPALFNISLIQLQWERHYDLYLKCSSLSLLPFFAESKEFLDKWKKFKKRKRSQFMKLLQD